MNQRRSLIVVATTVIVTLAPTTAQAHFRVNDHRWWFGGSTNREQYEHGKVDPVNMYFSFAETKGEIDNHFNDHWGPGEPDEWIEDEALPGALRCKGDQWVNFRTKASGDGDLVRRPTNFHGVGVGRSQGRCLNRYHIRFWGDAFHEQETGVTHTPRDAWTIGGAHYEESRPGHKPALDWDVVEHRVVRIMRPHAYRLRWRCLPNSYGMYQGYRSDGRITRLSMRHGGGVIDYGQGRC